MSIESDGKRLQLRIAAPEGGAPLRLKDGDTVLWEGNLAQGLDLEFDLEDWGVPEALRQLLSISLPSVDRYSREAFVPLDTALISLATLDVDPATGRGRWSDRAILPGQMLPLSMMSGVLHYAQSVFEGAKVFFVRDGDGVSARMFRGRRNAARMWRSALRMGIPLDTSEVGPMPLTAQGFEELYLALVRDAVMANVRAGLFEGAFSALDVASDDFNWTATPPALYVRPLLFASGPVLGVKPSGHYTFAVYVTPVGKYRSDMVLRVEREHPRAVKGGTGGVKASCNYAPTLTLMKALTENKASVTASTPWMSVFDDILFLGPGEQIEEMGGANFFVLYQQDKRMILTTPPSLQESEAADTILPGVTRDTVTRIADLLGVEVRVDSIPLGRLMELGPEDARKTVVFTTGTAAGIAPVVALLDGDRTQRFAVWDAVDDVNRNRRLAADEPDPGSALAMGHRIRQALFKLQLGDHAGLRTVLPMVADDLIEMVTGEDWVESFPI